MEKEINVAKNFRGWLESRKGEDTLYLPQGSDLGSFDSESLLETISDINKNYKDAKIYCLYMGSSKGRYELRMIYEDLDNYVLYLDENKLDDYSEKYVELVEMTDMESSEKCY